MNKLFRPKCLRRVLLCLALLFPIVYLCGGLFFALAGSHGEQIFAEPVYTEQYVQVESIDTEGKYKIDFDVENFLKNSIDYFNTSVNFTFNNTLFNNIRYFVWTGGNKIIQLRNDSLSLSINGSITPENVINLDSPSPWIIYCNENFSQIIPVLQYSTIYKLMSVPTEFVPENNSAYTEFIFSQPFENNNFITTLGKDLVNGSTKGFAPMNDLFRFINSNMLHFEDTDGLAMFGLGYVYYAVNVLIVYEVLILAVKLIMLPLKAVDLFDRKEDI